MIEKMTTRDTAHRTRKTDAGWRKYIVPGLLIVSTGSGGGLTVLVYRVEQLEAHERDDRLHAEEDRRRFEGLAVWRAKIDAEIATIHERHTMENDRFRGSGRYSGGG